MSSVTSAFATKHPPWKLARPWPSANFPLVCNVQWSRSQQLYRYGDQPGPKWPAARLQYSPSFAWHVWHLTTRKISDANLPVTVCPSASGAFPAGWVYCLPSAAYHFFQHPGGYTWSTLRSCMVRWLFLCVSMIYCGVCMTIVCLAASASNRTWLQ